MSDTTDQLVLLTVLALRLLVPLLIPRFPLPAIIAALLLDAADQTIFEQFTNRDLTSYQSYDKALDIYYLTIAYLATMRNWSNLPAFEVSRFLLYYRLVGVLLFEATENRSLLLIFPNTFEYFFIFYEIVRLRWDPRRMGPRFVMGAAAFIWVVIKLPQEYWIHVAQLDVTDTVQKYPLLGLAGLVAVALVLIGAWWIVTRRCPQADWSRSPFAPAEEASEADQRPERWHPPSGWVFERGLLEKIVLVSLVSIIFGQILPGMETSALRLSIGIAIVIVGNTVVSEWLARRGVDWKTAFRNFTAMLVVNIALTVLFSEILPLGNGTELHVGNTLFFLLLLTLLVMMYDRFRPHYLERVAAAA